MSTIIARSSESVHWYEQDGTPRYTVKAKDGHDRPTTLRDARKMDLVPSVTTILKIASKPGLEQWKLEQMLLAAMTLPRQAEESEKSYIARIVADSKEGAKQAADAGTRIHEIVEKHFGGHHDATFGDPVERILMEHFGVPKGHLWEVERSFATMGFGGKVDMYSEPDEILLYGAVVDVKTKEFGPGDKVEAYDEHLLQLAAYRHGLGLPFARCANIFVSRSQPGLVHIIEWTEDELKKGWEMFNLLLKYWCLKHSF